MLNKIELIIFKIAEHFIGIDSNEVEKVLKYIDNKKNKNEHAEKKYYACYADKLLNINEKINYNAALIIKEKNNQNIILYASNIEDFEAVDFEHILPIPEYIKKKQNPFFVWGFIEKPQCMIILITFDYFNKKDK